MLARRSTGSPSAEVADRAAAAARTLRDKVLDQSYKVPLLPDVACELMALATNHNASVRDIERAVRQEPAVAAKVVATANSSLYGGVGSVKSLKQAAMRLGVDALRDLLSQAVAEAYIFVGRRRLQLKALRAHSVAVAHLSRHMCGVLGIPPGYAFLCGLLHDIGSPLLLQMIDENPPPGIGDQEVEILIDLMHPIIGERVATQWNLPPIVSAVARVHHCYRGSRGQDPEIAAITTIVAAADCLAYHVGLGSREVPDLHAELVWNELALEPEQIDGLLEYAQTLTGV